MSDTPHLLMQVGAGERFTVYNLALVRTIQVSPEPETGRMQVTLEYGGTGGEVILRADEAAEFLEALGRFTVSP